MISVVRCQGATFLVSLDNFQQSSTFYDTLRQRSTIFGRVAPSATGPGSEKPVVEHKGNGIHGRRFLALSPSTSAVLAVFHFRVAVSHLGYVELHAFGRERPRRPRAIT